MTTTIETLYHTTTSGHGYVDATMLALHEHNTEYGDRLSDVYRTLIELATRPKGLSDRDTARIERIVGILNGDRYLEATTRHNHHDVTPATYNHNIAQINERLARLSLGVQLEEVSSN